MADTEVDSFFERTVKTNNSHINYLPESVLLHILSYMDYGSLCKCGRVCRKWNLLSKDYSLHRRIMIKDNLNDRQFKKLISRHLIHNVEEFQFFQRHGSLKLSSGTADELHYRCKRAISLKKMVLSSCTIIDIFSHNFPATLVHLGLPNSHFSSVEVFGGRPHIHFRNLRCLDLSGPQIYISSNDLWCLNSMVSLRVLVLDRCMRINTGGIESIKNVLLELLVLSIEFTDITDEAIHLVLQKCAKLRELYIASTCVGDGAFSSYTREAVPSLTTLCIKNTFITSRGLFRFVNSPNAPRMSIAANFDCNCDAFWEGKITYEPKFATTYRNWNCFQPDTFCHHHARHRCCDYI